MALLLIDGINGLMNIDRYYDNYVLIINYLTILMISCNFECTCSTLATCAL